MLPISYLISYLLVTYYLVVYFSSSPPLTNKFLEKKLFVVVLNSVLVTCVLISSRQATMLTTR